MNYFKGATFLLMAVLMVMLINHEIKKSEIKDLEEDLALIRASFLEEDDIKSFED